MSTGRKGKRRPVDIVVRVAKGQSNSCIGRLSSVTNRRFWLPLTLFLLLFGANFPAQSAEVGCDSTYDGKGFRDEESNKQRWPLGFRPKIGMCAAGYIVGEIQTGDFEKVRELYSDNHPFLWMFQLNSPGGEVEEAIKIGRLFRKYLLEAHAPKRMFGFSQFLFADKAECSEPDDSKCLCASACALIWFGAVYRVGDVGLHRPRTTSTAFGKAAPAQAEKWYKEELKHISAYLEEMEVPSPVSQKMLLTNSSDVRWVDGSEGLTWSPSYSEWIDATCGQFSEEERGTETKLESQKSRGLALSKNDQLLLKVLNGKDGQHSECLINKSWSSREALPAP